MKAIHLLPPLAAVFLIAVWAGVQRGTISTYNNEITLLKETIVHTRATLADPTATATASPRQGLTEQDGPIDWKAIISQIEAQQSGGGVGGMRATLRLQQQILEWETGRIVAALDEIKSLEISDQQRLMLEQMLVGPLGEKDPALAMKLFSHRIQDMGGWVLSGTMSHWLSSDPAAAISWFDHAIADGTFESKSLDGRSNARLQFESSVINALLKSNVSAAADRVASLPLRDRTELLGRLANNMQDPDGYISLVRGSLENEQEINQAITSAAANLAQRDDYQTAAEFLKQASLTPEAYIQAIETTALQRVQSLARKPITPADIQEMRAWVSTEAPGSEDRLTGVTLANAIRHSNETKFEDAVEMITRFQQASGNDDALYAFIDHSHSGQHQGKVRALIDNISDPEQRHLLLEKFE